MAKLTGLLDHHLQTTEDLKQVLLADEFATKRRVNADMRWVFGLLAVVLVLATYLLTIRIWEKLRNQR